MENNSNTLEVVYVSVPDYERNQEISNIVESIGGKTINFYTMDLEQLEFIAKHRILPVPTIIVIDNNRVTGRIVKDLPEVKELQHILDTLT